MYYIYVGDAMTDFSAFSKADYETLAELHYALRCFLRFSENAVETAGLTLQKHQDCYLSLGTPAANSLQSVSWLKGCKFAITSLLAW
jgi:hypothetical protein